MQTPRDRGAVLAIEPCTRPFDAMVSVPGSKSFSNRALILAALARGSSWLEGVLVADDVDAMRAGLGRLGIDIMAHGDGTVLEVRGRGGAIDRGPVVLDARAAGTVARFLPCVAALGHGPYTFDGTARMRARPIAPLITALVELGARVECLAQPLSLPFAMWGRLATASDSGARREGASEPAKVRVDASASSQYVSGLLMVAPCLPRGAEVEIVGPLVSRPYVDMTIAAMARFGARVRAVDHGRWRVEGGGYERCTYAIEPDASAASYFFGAAAITGSRVFVPGLGHDALQGDLRLVEVLAQMGCAVDVRADGTEVVGPARGTLRGVDVDMGDLSDVAQTLAVVAACARSETRVRGIGFIRHKESDRVGAVVTELRRVGVDAVEEPDGYLIRPRPLRGATIETYDDHRMAMSFSLLGLCTDGIAIRDPGCVAKTFPDWFDRLRALTGARSPNSGA